MGSLSTGRQVRGVLFIDYVKMLRRHKLAGGATTHLFPQDLVYLAGRLDPGQWYPMDTFERMGLEILDEVVGPEIDSIRLWGRSQLAGMIPFFPDLGHFADPRDAVMGLQTLLLSMFDFECVEIESVDDESAQVRVEYGMSELAEEAAAFQTMGFFEELVTANGGTSVQSERLPGGFVIEWNLRDERLSLPRQSVLVVDDQPLVLSGVARALEPHAMVSTARNGTEALALLERGPFDAVLADFDMGDDDELDGISLLAEIRRRWPSTRRVLHTGKLPHEVKEMKRLGVVDELVAKPASFDVLLDAVTRRS